MREHEWVRDFGPWDYCRNCRVVRGFHDETKSCPGPQTIGLREAAPGTPRQSSGAIESPWQPIETAPKDGQNVLVYRPFMGRMIAAWDYHDPEPFWVSLSEAGEANERRDSPTHWMPLPSPPTESEQRPASEPIPSLDPAERETNTGGTP